MKMHKCIQCGYCCTHLEPSTADVPGGLLLTPEETSVFAGDNSHDIIPTVAYTVLGDDDMQILYYGMVATVCPMYDDEEGCAIYEDRPLVCRRYPLGNNISDSNRKCPVVRDGGVLYEEETMDAMFDLDERSIDIMSTVPKGSILYIYNVENEEWDIIGVR